MSYSCIIVDDEQLAIDVIVKYIELIDNIEIKATCKNAVEANNIIQNTRIDLVFLDINMPVLSGMDFVKNLKDPPAIIFTTAYREFAVESYKLEALDYIVKPIPFERFLQAVNKFLRLKKVNIVNITNENNTVNSDYENFIFVKSEKKMIKIILDNILWIESMRNYVKIITTDKKVIVYQSLTGIEEKLPGKGFIRISRSFIIAIKHIQEFNMQHIKINDKWLKIGGIYKSEVVKFLQSFA